MKTIDEMISYILRREGGLVDDPNDRGGITNLGVSLRYAQGVGIKMDLDHDGDVDGDDIKLVTPDVAAELYRQDFFVKPRFDRLPAEIQPFMFDWAVNSGPPRPIMAMQQVLDAIGKLEKKWACAADGVIGPVTVKLARQVQDLMGPYFVNALVDERCAFYRRIADADAEQRRFLGGWLSRAEEFRVEVN